MDCPTCGKSLATEQGMRQHHTKVHGDPLPNRTCKGCGTEFYDEKARRKFCDDCNPNGGEHNGNWKDAKEATECKRCGDEFEYYPSDKKGVYCRQCVKDADEFLGDPYTKDAERVEKTCKHCGCEMTVLKSALDAGHGIFCSRPCHNEWMSENRVGENHHQWEGGTFDYGRTWWRVRRAALDRDDHRCQNCGTSAEELGQEPDVHHIERVRDFENSPDAHTLDNVVTLCRSCHRNVEEGNIETPRPN